MNKKGIVKLISVEKMMRYADVHNLLYCDFCYGILYCTVPIKNTFLIVIIL